MTRFVLLGTAALAACSTDPCGSASLSPTLGAFDAPDIDMSLTWGAHVEMSDITLTPYDGDAPVPGRLELDGQRARFLPDAPLDDDRTYRIEASWTCNGAPAAADTEFSTRRFVQPVADPTQLIGGVWGSRGDTFRLVEPAGEVGAILGETVHMNWLPLLSIVDVDPHRGDVVTELVWSDTWADAPEQRPCSLPLALPSGRLTDPGLVVGPDDVEILTGVGSVMVEELEIHATVSQDGSGIGGLELFGRFDIRDLAEELGYDDYATFCADSYDLDYPCQPCSDGERACLPFHIDGVTAERQSDVRIEREDTCAITDQIVVWGRDALYRAAPDSTVVTEVHFDGREGWSVDLEAPIVQLSWDDGHELPLVVLVRHGTVLEEWRIDPATGDAISFGTNRSAAALFGVILMFGAITSIFWGGGCATAGSTPMGLAPVLLALLAIARRRP